MAGMMRHVRVAAAPFLAMPKLALQKLFGVCLSSLRGRHLLNTALVKPSLRAKLCIVLSVIPRNCVLDPLHVVCLEVEVTELCPVRRALQGRLLPVVEQPLH